jgi:hypothetical protein
MRLNGESGTVRDRSSLNGFAAWLELRGLPG